jgi:hypothetical protein
MHPCRADECSEQVEAKHAMCLRHWRMVPKDLQRALYRAYRIGTDSAYTLALNAAIAAVAAREEEARGQVSRS